MKNLQREERQLRAAMRAMPRHKSRRHLKNDLKVDNLVTTMRHRLIAGKGLGDTEVEDRYYSPTENTHVITGESSSPSGYGLGCCGCNNPTKSQLMKLVAFGLVAVGAYALLVQPLLRA